MGGNTDNKGNKEEIKVGFFGKCAQQIYNEGKLTRKSSFLLGVATAILGYFGYQKYKNRDAE